MYKQIWEQCIQEFGTPSYYSGIKEINFDTFANNINNENFEFSRSLIGDLCKGNFILIKNAFPAEFIIHLKREVKKFWEKHPESFSKIIDNCKDFHRSITPELSKNYSVNAVKHATFFFPWNNDPCKINEIIFNKWDLIKTISGFKPQQFRSNHPKDLVIDRIQIAVYPPGFGELEAHTDPVNNTKIATNIYLSSYKNGDFQSGGFYFLDKNNNKINIETYIDIGDIGMFYGNVLHGVDAIDENISTFDINQYDWNSGIGRWFLGLNTIDSDMHPSRTTTVAK